VAPRERVLSGMRPTGRLHPGNWVGCLDCKGVLLEHMLPPLAEIRERRQRFVEKPQAIVDILHEGSKRARRVAQQTMQEVRDAVRLEP
jgi:tryptophanyl-tRNA synthetase